MRIGSLFSGYGGLDLACERFFEGRTVWTSDVSKGACKVLAHRFPDAPNLGDITAIDWETVPRVDVICGGSPCQDVSSAGKRAGMVEGTRSNLWQAMRTAPRRSARMRGLTCAIPSLPAVSDRIPCPRTFSQTTNPLAAPADSALDARHSARSTQRGQQCGPHDGDRESGAGIAADAYGLGEGEPVTVGGGDLPAQPARTGATAADATVQGLEGNHREEPGEAGRHRHSQPGVDFGPYADAVRRWEHVTGLTVPAPTIQSRYGKPRLSPRFTEWMMGLEPGWITDVPVTHREALELCGNGVVPQQALTALLMISAQWHSVEVAA